MRRYSNTLVFLIALLLHYIGLAQSLQISSQLEQIEILEDSSFVNNTTVKFKRSNENRVFPIIYDDELEQVSDVQIFIKKGRRLKELPIKKIQEERVELDIINSKKIKIIEIPANEEIELKYTISCNELMYFSRLPLFSYDDIDTLDYRIKVPKKFNFDHNTIYKDSLSFYEVDSTINDLNAFWKIKTTPKKINPNPLYYFGIYKNLKVPFMRVIVTPNSYRNQPRKYLNDWYMKEISKKKVINASVKQKIDELTANVSDTKEKINIIYNYVKNNFKYVAIEIGMGAFIPSHVNEVFLNKQGDCKDLSNFLTEVLNYKGVKSDIALAATFDHISDCDFPSLSSANHVISVAYVGEEIILLDPTDTIHLEGTPVQSLQDQTILIVNSEGGSFYKVKKSSPKTNEIHYDLELNINSGNQQIKGLFNIDYSGISSNYLRRIFLSLNKTEFLDYSKAFFTEVFGNQSISNLELINNYKKFHYKGNISILGKTFNDDSNLYLFIDFLPKLFETENQESLLPGTYLGAPFSKKVRVKLKSDLPVNYIKETTHKFDENGISLSMTIKSTSETTIECSYDFSFDYIFITNKNVNEANNILKSFKKIINEPIVIEKQKN
jgi:hypothetical protein